MFPLRMHRDPMKNFYSIKIESVLRLFEISNVLLPIRRFFMFVYILSKKKIRHGKWTINKNVRLLGTFSDESTLIRQVWHLQWGCSSRLRPRIQWISSVTRNPRSAIMEIRRRDRCRVVKNRRTVSTIAASPARKASSMGPGRTIASSTAPYR